MHSIENCPSCGSKMDKGYIITLHDPPDQYGKFQITWKKKKRIVTEVLIELARPGNLFYHEAYRCQSCKLILFHYDEKEKE